jgi:ABC-type uncharacterized transport system ATPase subunit
MIEVAALTKRYGKLVANRDISLAMQPGELAVLLRSPLVHQIKGATSSVPR